MAHNIRRIMKFVSPLVLVAVTALAGPASAGDDVTAAAPVWHYHDLNTASGAPERGVRDMVAFTAGKRWIFFVDDEATPRLNEFHYSGGNWHHDYIDAPTPGSRLTGFAWNGAEPRLYYGDSRNHVIEVDGTGGVWRVRDLTVETGAPVRSIKAISAFQINSSETRVYYTTNGDSDDSHVRELSYFNERWHHRDLYNILAGTADGSSNLLAWTAGGVDSRVYFTKGWHLEE